MTLDASDPSDRERLARLYRHARVLVHETRQDAVRIVADIPRRLLPRLGPAKR
jgi:hypothetical protein